MRLTSREREVLQSMMGGETTKQTALRLGLAYSTVRTHKWKLYRKLGVSNAPQAVAKALRR